MEAPKKAHEWQTIIEECMKAAGTHKDCFILPVKTLAAILEKRDKAEAFLEETGGEILVEHVNQGGNVYIEQNPAVRLINDLNRDALTYMRECGITPKGLKQITEKLQTEAPKDPFFDMIRRVEEMTQEYDEDGDPVERVVSGGKEIVRKMTPEEIAKRETKLDVKLRKREP